jgi:outer membrane protein
MRIVLVSAVVLSSVLGVRAASAAEASPTGLEVGVRTGYGLPLGHTTGAPAANLPAGSTGPASSNLSDLVIGQLPFWLDAGYRLSPEIYVGGFMQYAVTFPASNGSTGCALTGASCSGNDIQAGVDLQYHFPRASYDPWVGVGVGYEWLNTSLSASGQSGGIQIAGWQFLNLQVGCDLKVGSNVSVGPFAMLSVGVYDYASTSGALPPAVLGQEYDIREGHGYEALHEWLTFGVRGAYDISLVGQAAR